MSQQGDYSGKYFGDYFGGASGAVGVLEGSVSIRVSARALLSTQPWADINAKSLAKKRKPPIKIGREWADAEEMRRSIALLRQIEEEDEIALALVMSAVPLLGADQWRQ